MSRLIEKGEKRIFLFWNWKMVAGMDDEGRFIGSYNLIDYFDDRNKDGIWEQ